MKASVKEMREQVKKNKTWTKEFKDGYAYGFWLGLVMANGKSKKQIREIASLLYTE